ncbi:hypothetical protein BDP27DRAFT_1437061 [Rhodocollybia butyracea]|uniref:DASH complex subunit ASK1 n=1 Tax=Rhodocollybia butyracea TaxID=206335 RepID=A0A9P5P509_9AGAR|nr:hypothetical protein BDP27DRAFT_1437061 [Rhodocollybia butyracea]
MPDNRKPVSPNPPRWTPQNPETMQLPGVDSSASPQDQIEQIEQQITLKLQNIDENFSKIHNVLSTRILPAVKRFAVGTEPVREAAKFWVSFYEQAAQIRIPTYEDYATVNESSSEQQESAGTSQTEMESSAADDYNEHDHSIASTESSFAPGKAAFSSTPAADRLAHALHPSDEPSWSASLESPLVRLDREIKNFSQDAVETESSFAPTPTRYRHEERSQRSIDKGKSREQPEPLLRNLLRQNVSTSAPTTAPSVSVSPLRPRTKGKTPILKDMNPFLPPGAQPSKWNGIVDLRDASTMTPQHSKRFREPASYKKFASPEKATDDDDDSDDSWDGLPPGMSPPVLLSPARPIKFKLGQTPKKAAAARITKDIVADIQGRAGGTKPARGLFPSAGESDSSSSMPSPPSLSRYNLSASTGTDSSLESMMRQVGLRDPIPGQPSRYDGRYDYSITRESLPLPRLSANLGSSSLTPNAIKINEDEFLTPTAQQFQNDYYDDDDDDDDDVINNTAHPSAAFLMASQSRRPLGEEDDSFDDDDSMVEGDEPFNQNDLIAASAGDPNILIPVHPFARGVSIEDDSFDDSFDNDVGQMNPDGMGMMSEETLFGVPPAQREQRIGMSTGRQLMMHGGDLLDTEQLTDDIGKAAETPTPAVWNRRG